ncbi:hypothetical protein FHS20_003583 [Phyllobacterium endophyticum]|nr:hypothetical protein [Phyllobacterium endophyticum]
MADYFDRTADRFPALKGTDTYAAKAKSITASK